MDIKAAIFEKAKDQLREKLDNVALGELESSDLTLSLESYDEDWSKVISPAQTALDELENILWLFSKADFLDLQSDYAHLEEALHLGRNDEDGDFFDDSSDAVKEKFIEMKRLAVHERYDSLRSKIMGLKTKVDSYSIDDFDMESAEDLIDEDTYNEGRSEE